ncbi:hypothetical protein H310_01909 [Aphanomyces invadans]|uniref:Vacuolar protein 8 n=1 Tax=Aphanomyces invadans TaxID=157072 RepID=A0A024UP38_9STRA|nr:hypothetical protein H310_01909 [Aphanomyces invadans]ETW07383.1 hypothetical protein H310_01909 [Aphanomyces invadans]|eukprot:XP_008863476.1 hypothetical protein H310_01909 [Aphanomyces invadans]
MGQIASAPCGSSLGPSTACSATTWEEVDVDDLQTQPIDIRHFLRRAEDEAMCWKHDHRPMQVQPIRLLTPADSFANTSELSKAKTGPTKPPFMPPVMMTPDEACAVLPSLMEDRWIYPLVALVGSKDMKVTEMALAALASIVDSESRQAMAIEAQCMAKLVHAMSLAHFQRLAFDALTALCHRNRSAALDILSQGVVDILFEVFKLKLTNSDDRKCSGLQLLLVLVKQAEGRALVATQARVAILVDFISHFHAPIAFYALSCLGELFQGESARKSAIALGVLPILLRFLHSTATCNKTILLQAVYILSIMGTHEANAFPMAESVQALCHVMDILRGALKRSRLASLVCMFVAGLSWKHPSCQRFQHAVRDNSAPNLFAILASLLIGGSNDVLCAAAIAVGALCHRCLPNVHAFAKLDVHTTLAKLLPHKDDRVVGCAAMALTRFLTPYTLQAKHAHLLCEPWQQEIAQAIADCTSPEGSSLDVLYASVLRKSPCRPCDPIALDAAPLLSQMSAFELQAALDLFVFTRNKRRWTNDEAVQCLLDCVGSAASDMQLELLLFFQTCTDPLGGDIEAVDFCNLVLAHDGVPLFLSLLRAPDQAASHLCSVLQILKHFAVVYHTTLWPQPPDALPDLVRQVVALIGRMDAVDVQRAAAKLLDILTEAKSGHINATLTTILATDPHCVANLLFVQCHTIQHAAGVVVSRLVRHSQGHWAPLPSALLQLTALLRSPSHEVTFAASHAWGSLLERLDLCHVFSKHDGAVAALLDLLDVPNRRPKHLVDTGRTLYRAAKHADIQPHLLGRGLALLEKLSLHPVHALAHYAMLTLSLMGKNDSLRPAVVSPTLVTHLHEFVAVGAHALGDKDDNSASTFPKPRRLSNLTDALCWIGEVALDAATQQTLLHAGVVDQVAQVVLMKGPISDIKLCALTALASVCSSDPSTRNHVLGDALVDAVLRYLDVEHATTSDDDEVVLICLNIVLHLLRTPAAQAIIAKSPRMGSIVQTLRYTSSKIRSLAAQVLALLAKRFDSVKADLCRMDVNNILLNIIVSESVSIITNSNDDDMSTSAHVRVNPSSRVQRHALHALAVLCEGSSPASKTNKHEILDFPLGTTLTDLLHVPDTDDAVEATALLAAVIANVTHHSTRNQRTLLQRDVEPKCIALLKFVFEDKASPAPPSSFLELLAVESMKTLTNLATHPENRKEMGADDAIYGALLMGLQSDVTALHRFAALTMAHLCTGNNDPHKIAMGSYGSLLPVLSERLSSKHPHVLENVCFAITKLGTHGGNKIVLGANLIFERLLPLVLHTEIAIQKMAMTAIAILIDGNDRNKVSLVECNAIPILCSLCNNHSTTPVHGRILEGALHTLSELVATQVVEVSKYINPTMVIDMLGSVNGKLQKAALVLLSHLTRESFNKLLFGVPPCIAALVVCLHTAPRADDSSERDDGEDDSPSALDLPSLLSSEADLVLVELAATSLANLSFEAANTDMIVADSDHQLIPRLGELMESAMQVAHETRASPSKKKQLSPLKAKMSVPNNQDSHSDNNGQRLAAPLLASRPMQCQHILEQCVLIVNNCAHVILRHGAVTESIVAILCRMLTHSSDLVKKCACFALTTWCSKHPQHQQWVLAQPTAALSTLIGMLNSSSPGIVEAALWILTKLSMYDDTYVKMVANDIVRILEHIIFRYHTTLGSGVLDRAIRLLGNLGLHDVVRKTIRGEAIVSGPLTSILDHQKDTPTPSSPTVHSTKATIISHVKNTARLISILLTDDALKLFFPKRTLGVLQTIYVLPSTAIKVRRNIIVIFWLLSVVEEHREQLAHPEKDVVGRLVSALARDEHELFVRANVLAMLAMWSQHESICQTLYSRDVVAAVLKYLVIPELGCDTFCAVIVHHLSNLKEAVRTTLAAEGTTEIVLSLLDRCVSHPTPFDPFGYHLVGILANLTVQDDVKSVVVHVHGIATILALLRQNINYRFLDDSTGGDLLDLFGKVAANLSFDDPCKSELIHGGGLELVLQVLSRGYASLTGVENYVLCVGNLSTVADSIPRLEAASAIPILLQLLKTHHVTSPWIVKCTIWAISNMAMDSTTSKHQIHGYPGGLDLVLSLLVTESCKQTDTIVECAMTCLSSIVQEEEIAHALGECPTIGHILLFLEPQVRQSLQRKAVKTVGCLASFGIAMYIDDLSRTHTHLLSIATDSNLKSIAPTAINALRRIAYLRNESPHVLCANVHGIDALLQLLQSDSASTVLDALHLIHHVAMVTATISTNAEYFASKRACTQASELLVSPNVEIQEGVVQLCAYLVKNTEFDECTRHVENWPLVLSRLCRWWEQQTNFTVHALCPSVLAGLDQMLRFPAFIHSLNDAILTKASLQCLVDSLPSLAVLEVEPWETTLVCVRALVHLAAESSSYMQMLCHVNLPAQLMHLLLATPDNETALLRIVLRGIALYCIKAPTSCEAFVQMRGAVRLLQLLSDPDADVVSTALAIIELQLRVPTAPEVFRRANAVYVMASKLEGKTGPANSIRLLSCLATLWEDSPAACAAFHESRVVSIVMTTTLHVHRTESLTVLHAMSTSVAFHATLFQDASMFLDVLRTRTGQCGNDTVLVLLILCNMCGCGPSFDNNMSEAPIQSSFVMEWVDMNILGTLLPLSQWLDAVPPPRRSTKVSMLWETEVELVLRILSQVTRDAHLRQVFRDGVDLPDLLSLLRPQASTGALLGMGVVCGATQVLANISLEKEIQIMIIVEDGITFLAKLIMQKIHHDKLALALVRTVRNLSHDTEVQAILAAHATLPYFLQCMQVLAAMPDMALSSGLEVLSLEIIHDVTKTIQWTDTLVGHQCQEALLALIDRHVDECHSVSIESVAVQSLVNLTHTSNVDALCASNTVRRMAQLVSTHYFPTFSTLSERKAAQFTALLQGLTRCVHSSENARHQLATSDTFLQQLTSWFVCGAAEYADEVHAVSLLANLALVPTARHCMTRHAAPTLLARVAQVCMDVQATRETHVSCFHVLSQCLGSDIDPVDQSGWEYAFVPDFIACAPFEHALANALGPSTATDCLAVFQGCLRHGGYATSPFPVPLAVLVAVIAFVGSTDHALAVGILQQLVVESACRRLIVASFAFDKFVNVVGSRSELLGQTSVQTIARQLVDDALDIHFPRDDSVVATLVHSFLQQDGMQLSVLSLLGHLALFSPHSCGVVMREIQASALAMALLSRHVETIHARTCTRATINASSVVSIHDMLRVYLFAVTLQTPTWNDATTAVCFVSDILSWFTSQRAAHRFVDIYPVLLYCTSSLLKPTARTTATKGARPTERSSGNKVDDAPWQADILRDVMHILTVATDVPIQVASLNTLVAFTKLWQADQKLLTLLESLPTRAAALQQIVGLLTTAQTAALETLTLLVTAGHHNIVDELKEMGAKVQLEALQVSTPHEKAMTTAILDLLGYSMDLSEAFVLDLQAFTDTSNNPADRGAMMAKLRATLDRDVVTDHSILTAIIPKLVEAAAQDRAFLNDCIQCLYKVSGFPAFAQCTMAPPILLRLYVNEFATLTAETQGFLLDMLFVLQATHGDATTSDFDFHDEWNPLAKLLTLATSLLVCDLPTAARIMTFVWIAVAGNGDLLHVLASQAQLLVPLCSVLHGPPPPMTKKIDQLAKPNQVVHVILLRLIHALSTMPTLSSDMLKPLSPLVEALVHCLASYPLHLNPKQHAPQLAYINDIALIVLQYASHLAISTLHLDTALKQLMVAVESVPPPHELRLFLLQLLASLTQMAPVVAALHRLQGLDSFVRLFVSSASRLDQLATVLACLAQASRIGELESEVVARLVGQPTAATDLLQCLCRSSREPQEHAAYLLSAMLLHRPEVGGSAGCVSMLIECLEAVDLVVVRYVLVCLGSVLHIDGTQETLLRHATVPVLAQILQKADATCTQHVLRVLAILCSKHKAAVCRRVVAANLLGILMATVRGKDQPTSNVFHAAWVLSCVSKDSDLSLRLQEVDPNFVLEVVQLVDVYPVPTANKLLRMAANVWTQAFAGLPVAGIVRKLLSVVPTSESRQVQKNGGRVLCLLFSLPDLDGQNDVAFVLAQYLFDSLTSNLDKLVAAALRALVDGLQQPDSTTDRCIRDLVAEESSHFLHLLRLVSTNSFHPVINRLDLALQFLTALIDSSDMVQRLEPLVLPSLLHLLSNDPLVHLNAPTIKQLLGLLSNLTRSNATSLAMSPIVVGAVKRLVCLVQDEDSYHSEALHVLVNFASVTDLRQSIVLHGGLAALLHELDDDMVDAHLQLVLLGIASLSADDLAKQTVPFVPHVPRFMALLSAPNANVQSLAVWVVSNICGIDAVRRAINAQHGATVLQSLLNEVVSPAMTSRPLSSSARIREMAPKAIQDLGFAPLHM